MEDFYLHGGGRGFSSERCRTSNCHGDSRECILHRQRLVKVELCEGLREIGEQAFKYCKHLFSVEIPEHVIVIVLSKL